MKRLWFLLPAALLLLSAGCAKAEQPDHTFREELTDIPETLTIEAKLPKDVPSKASTYKVSYKKFDTDQLLGLFHIDPESFSERTAFGPRYESGNSLFDIFDEEGVLPGGFSYLKDMSYIHATSIITAVSQENLDFMKAHAIEAFSDDEALSFMETLGLQKEPGKLEIEQAYTFSGEELNKVNASDHCAPKDQFTYVCFRQSVDGIPFTSTGWKINQPYVEAEVTIRDHQVIDARFVNLFEVEKKISSGSLLSPEAILNLFIDDYNKKIETDITTITNMCFCYVVAEASDGMYAQPAYIVDYEYETEFENSTEPGTIEMTVTFSAMDGKIIGTI